MLLISCLSALLLDLGLCGLMVGSYVFFDCVIGFILGSVFYCWGLVVYIY